MLTMRFRYLECTHSTLIVMRVSNLGEEVELDLLEFQVTPVNTSLSSFLVDIGSLVNGSLVNQDCQSFCRTSLQA